MADDDTETPDDAPERGGHGKTIEMRAIGRAQPVQVWPPPPTDPENRQARLKAATGRGKAYANPDPDRRALRGKARRRALRAARKAARG